MEYILLYPSQKQKSDQKKKEERKKQKRIWLFQKTPK
jgi:hypothetical protein